MKNKILKVPRCTKEDIERCHHPMSKRKWDDQYVCEVLRPIDCPHLLCEEEPCVAGAVIDTNSEEVEFPCSVCGKPTKQERQEALKKMTKELGFN